MESLPKGSAAIIIIAGGLCCGLLSLIVSGVLGGLWVWVFNGGAAAIVAAAVVTSGLIIVFRYVIRRNAVADSKRNGGN